MDDPATVTTAAASPPSTAEPRTYHCLCYTFSLSTVFDLDDLPRRPDSLDEAIILPVSSETGQHPWAVLQNITLAPQSIMIRREDGFEKRKLLSCNRCRLTIGYQLDEVHLAHSAVDPLRRIYLLPGSLLSTTAVKTGSVSAEVPPWAQNNTT